MSHFSTKLFAFILILGTPLLLISQIHTEYRNGEKKKFEIKIHPNTNKSLRTFWYRNGNKSTEANYLNDSLHGKIVEWYRNGQLKLIGSYSNGLKSEKWKYWYKNGTIMSQQFYVNNTIDDWSILYHNNGVMKEKAYYINGMLEGEWKSWYKNEQKFEEGKCVNGQKHGIWIEWYPNGRKKRLAYYNHGYLEINPIFWWSNGKLSTESSRELERIYSISEEYQTPAEKEILKRNLKYFRKR